jgi:peptidoglycan-N-acetylglucosamine deacetylase
MNKQVFYDPQRKRWKRLRRLFDLLALLGLVLGSVFVVGLVRMKPLPELFLQTQKRNYRALANQSLAGFKLRRSAHRRTDIKPGDVPLNSGEGLRAAYYVEDDAASYSSLKQHISQVDILFPEWLHVITPNGKVMAYAPDNTPYPLIDRGTVHQVDREAKVARTVATSHVNLDIFPLVNN